MIAGISLLGGCHLLFPFDTDAPGLDTVATDGAPALDRLSDAGADREPLPVDFEGVQTEASLPPSDGAPKDAPSPDKALPDGLLPDPCFPTATSLFSWSNKMALCSSSIGRSQCDAEKNCNTSYGWHLCTPGEFIAYGGDKQSPPATVATAWLSGCSKQSKGVYGYPASGPCSCVTASATGTVADVMYHCGSKTSAKTSSFSHLGLHTELSCFALGSSSGSQGFWGLSATKGTESKYSVCCAP